MVSWTQIKKSGHSEQKQKNKKGSQFKSRVTLNKNWVRAGRLAENGFLDTQKIGSLSKKTSYYMEVLGNLLSQTYNFRHTYDKHSITRYYGWSGEPSQLNLFRNLVPLKFPLQDLRKTGCGQKEICIGNYNSKVNFEEVVHWVYTLYIVKKGMVKRPFVSYCCCLWSKLCRYIK